MKRRLYVFGTGGHARKVTQAALLSGWEVIGFLDENPQVTSPIQGLNVIKDIQSAIAIEPRFIVAIGNNQDRKRVFEMMKSFGGTPVIIQHPNAYVAIDASIGGGSVIMANAVIDSQASVGICGIIDIGVMIDHDAKIGDYCHVKPGIVVLPMQIINSGIR